MFPCEMGRYIAGFSQEARKLGLFRRFRGERHRLPGLGVDYLSFQGPGLQGIVRLAVAPVELPRSFACQPLPPGAKKSSGPGLLVPEVIPRECNLRLIRIKYTLLPYFHKAIFRRLLPPGVKQCAQSFRSVRWQSRFQHLQRYGPQAPPTPSNPPKQQRRARRGALPKAPSVSGATRR